MAYLFTSESVSEGHPDKIADQISDAILDNILAYDPPAKVACETLVTTGQVIIAGELKTDTYVDVQQIARDVINHIGYTKSEYMFEGNSCGVLNALHEQSPDIARGVVKDNPLEQGAGDQGMMFGYACRETDDYMPLPIELSHRILMELADIRHEGRLMKYLRPDAKAQVTVQYNDKDERPVRIYAIVISTQHDEFDEDDTKMLGTIKDDVKKILISRLIKKLPPRVQKMFDDDMILHVNPTGKFVIGGPHGDTGLTGRKIIVDTYGGRGTHGGGSFSGKDPSKVDRSAAYAARHMAKNLVAAGFADKLEVQMAYAIGVAEPISVYINTYGTAKIEMSDSEIAKKLLNIFDLRPAAIEQRLKLRNPIYSETAAYGHMGRTPKVVKKKFESQYHNGVEKEVELFTWEKLDYVDKIRKEFGL
ncbi:MAG: methionine adenosyltransferase [Bacteroidota bacterium]|nr:methionine adenosyltransferase [Bacteroidota bacterium]